MRWRSTVYEIKSYYVALLLGPSQEGKPHHIHPAEASTRLRHASLDTNKTRACITRQRPLARSVSPFFQAEVRLHARVYGLPKPCLFAPRLLPCPLSLTSLPLSRPTVRDTLQLSIPRYLPSPRSAGASGCERPRQTSGPRSATGTRSQSSFRGPCKRGRRGKIKAGE